MATLLKSDCCGADVNHLENVWVVYGPCTKEGDFGEKLKDWSGDDSEYQCSECGEQCDYT